MKNLSKLLLLILVVLIVSCKSQKDVALQDELDKKMDEFYNRDYKIMAIDIINGENNYFYKCITTPKKKKDEYEYFLLFIIKTKEGIEVCVKINERDVIRIYDETVNSPIANFTVGKYPLHRRFSIDSLKTVPEAVNEFIGSAKIRGKTKEIRDY